MSYDIEIVDPVTRAVLQHREPHYLRGGTYAVGGTRQLTLNVTWNYAPHFYRLLGPQGIRAIYGRPVLETVPLLTQAARQLAGDVHPDYWNPTEGNARAALLDLAKLALLGPQGEWQGD